FERGEAERVLRLVEILPGDDIPTDIDTIEIIGEDSSEAEVFLIFDVDHRSVLSVTCFLDDFKTVEAFQLNYLYTVPIGFEVAPPSNPASVYRTKSTLRRLQRSSSLTSFHDGIVRQSIGTLTRGYEKY